MMSNSVLKLSNGIEIDRLYEFESSTSSVVRARNDRTEHFLTKVTLPFSIKLGKSKLVDDGNLYI